MFLVINFCQSFHPVFAEHLLCAEFKEVSGTQAGLSLQDPSWCEAAPSRVRAPFGLGDDAGVFMELREETGARPAQGVSKGLLEAGVGGSWRVPRCQQRRGGHAGQRGNRRQVVEERPLWFGVAGALGQAVASGDGAGEGLRAAHRAGCQSLVAGPSAERWGGRASAELLGLLREQPGGSPLRAVSGAQAACPPGRGDDLIAALQQ